MANASKKEINTDKKVAMIVVRKEFFTIGQNCAEERTVLMCCPRIVPKSINIGKRTVIPKYTRSK